MTNRMRSARALRAVRTRMRDLAAASHSAATAQHDDAERAVRTEEDRLESFLDEALGALAEATHVTAIERVGTYVDDHKQAIGVAVAVHQTSVTRLQESHGALVASTRQLKTAEKIVERIDAEVARREARAEQRANDDMNRKARKL